MIKESQNSVEETQGNIWPVVAYRDEKKKKKKSINPSNVLEVKAKDVMLA